MRLTPLALLLATLPALAQEPETAPPLVAVQAYTQDELAELIRAKRHLTQVKADKCQLVDDIEARAVKLKEPTYQFLYGDMLAWGVCYPADGALGLHYIKEAAGQGLPEALEQLGRYYRDGTLVQADETRAILYTREAASLGNLDAQLALAEMLLAGKGSPYDYSDAYRWLHHAVITDPKVHAKAKKLLKRLAGEMPAAAVERAKRPPELQ